MRRILIASLVLAIGCSDSDTRPATQPEPDAGAFDGGEPDVAIDMMMAPVVASVAIVPEQPTIAVGERLALVATPLDDEGNEVTTTGVAQWQSSDPSVAPISTGGEVLGASVGTTTITASFGDVSAMVDLTVADVRVDSVDVLPARVVFTIGDTFTFVASPLDANGDRIDSGLPVSWSIENGAIATVENATVTAVAAGTTNLVATVAGVEGRAELVVEDAVLEGLAIDQVDPSLVPTDTTDLTVTFSWQAAPPANLPTVAWSTSDDTVATVADGTITAVSPGTAQITATTGSFDDSVTVEVFGDFNEVAAGASHACARIRGAVFCWGDDTEGQLGHDAAGFARAGTQSFTQVVTGRAHTCAKTAGDEIWCWGANDQGQLGLGDTMTRDLPTRITGTFAGTLRATRDTTCAGNQCWGAIAGSAVTSPTNQGGTLFVGGGHNCLISGGTTTCSGANDQGQLGINTTGATGSGTPVGGYTFSVLALGDLFSCGIVTGGGLACWGDGDLGQVGDANFTDSAVPLLVPLATTVGGLVAGSRHVCVRLPNGSAQCWGANDEGQLGIGNTTNTGSPTDVTGGRAWSFLSTEADQTCGLDDTGSVWCWGNGVDAPDALQPAW